MIRVFPFAAALVLVTAVQPTSAQEPVPSGKAQFARDILPILSANCFTCHGPDEKPRKAGLRLDLGETATKKLKSGSRAVVPGDLVYIPPDTVHSLRPTGDAPIHCFCFAVGVKGAGPIDYTTH